MSLSIHCPICHGELTATPDLIGRVVGCPHCSRHLVITGEGADAMVVATPESNLAIPPIRIRFTFTCLRCRSILEASSDLCGKQGRCPTCGAVFVIPPVDVRTGIPTEPALVVKDGQLPTPLHAYANAGDKAPKIVRLLSGEPVIECPRCQRRAAIESNLCDSCGMPFTMEGATAISESSLQPTNQLAVASLLVGVISLPASCAPGAGLAAMALGWAAIRKADRMGPYARGRNAALAGILCGALSQVWLVRFFM